LRDVPWKRAHVAVQKIAVRLAEEDGDDRVRRTVKTLIVQVQPERAPALDAGALCRELQRYGETSRLVRDCFVANADEGRAVDVYFAGDDLSALWNDLAKRFIHGAAPLSRVAIVVCEGEEGWSDYKLLHHYDEREVLDPA
jgi:hypothetical protein